MTDTNEQPHEGAEVIPINAEQRCRLWPVERINGIKMNLGRMSLEELQLLATQCLAREEDVRLDRLIVQDHIDARFKPEEEGF